MITQVDTTQLHILSLQFEQLTNDFANQLISSIHQLSSQLDYEWRGQAHTAYQQNLDAWWSSINQMLHVSEEAAQYLQETMRQTQFADSGNYY